MNAVLLLFVIATVCFIARGRIDHHRPPRAEIEELPDLSLEPGPWEAYRQ